MRWRCCLKHHQLSGHECEQTPGGSEGQGGLGCCRPRGHRAGHDLATEKQRQKSGTRRRESSEVARAWEDFGNTEANFSVSFCVHMDLDEPRQGSGSGEHTDERGEPSVASRAAALWHRGHPSGYTEPLSTLHAGVLLRVQPGQTQTFPTVSSVGKPQETG